MEDSLKGRLLVAAPTLQDPNFHRTVVLVIEHGDEGALGVVLNRPSLSPVSGPLPDWAPVSAEPAVLFLGGPVTPGNVVGLARVVAPARPAIAGAGVTPVVGQIAVVDLNRHPTELGADVSDMRAFAGCAGWAPGQLEAEIGLGGWFVLDGGNDDVLSTEPEGLWVAVLRRQGGRLAMLATFPPELSRN